MKKWKPLLALICFIWFLFGLFTFSMDGHKYIGNSYFESEDFRYELGEFEDNLGPYVLNFPKADELKKSLTVSQSEIDEHRDYYGSLGDQVANIKAQYEMRIQEAAENDANDLKTKLETERDSKIKDITTNFEDDEHVRAKILKAKEEVIDSYIQTAQQEAKSFKKNYSYFSYHLVNTETGEDFSSGDVTENVIHKVNYTSQSPLHTWNISENLEHILYGADVYVNVNRSATSESVYSSESRGLFGNEMTTATDKVAVEQGEEETPTITQDYTYTGTIAITKSVLQSIGIEGDYKNFQRSQFIFGVIWLMSIVAAVIAWQDRKEAWHTVQEIKEKGVLAKLRIDIQVVVLFITGCIYWGSMFLTYEAVTPGSHYNTIRLLMGLSFNIIVMMIVGMAFFVQLMWLYNRVNTLEKLSSNLKDSYLFRLGEAATDLFLNRSIAVQSIVLVAAAFFGGGSFVAVLVGGGGFPILVFGICGIVGVPALVVFLSRMGYLNRIMKDTKDMAEGRLNRDVKVRGKSPLAKHAENLNHLREGVRTSMHEQAKSERLKTELITNVSHDLRTPLTSIITYTDLLKKPDITEEERQKYIQILDKKSERLKVLIEDLFEVSKMASGNIELHRSRVDLTQLVQQAVGEHEEDLVKSRLDLRMTMPQEPIYAYVDGQKWWRLVDNLTVNVLKYALEGTRVYVTLKRTANGDAEFTVKNVAKYEISENADELFERFKRADSSRHTDGSGLGLAIAQSIVDLHGARMSIDVDGDLFKVVVTIQAV